MRHKKIILIAVFLLISGLTTIQAQNTIAASGGNASGSGGSVSYSAGQIACQALSGTSVSITQGVQQPYEISISTGIDQAKDIFLACSAYPNPATDILTLNVENYDNENLLYRLFDSNGKLLESNKVTGNETTVSMANLLPGIYFLKVIDNKEEIITFKIIKK